MTTDPQQPDATTPEQDPGAEDDLQSVGLDQALLDEALSAHEPAPAELERKILALTDPPTLSLLDEALAPEAEQAFETRLNQRILAATLPGHAAENAPAVLARLTPSVRRYAAAAAAALVLAAGVGLWLLQQPDAAPSDQMANHNATAPGPADLESIEIPQTPALFADATSRIESDLRELADHLEGARINRDTIWSEMEAYEQFQTDLESDLSGLST